MSPQPPPRLPPARPSPPRPCCQTAVSPRSRPSQVCARPRCGPSRCAPLQLQTGVGSIPARVVPGKSSCPPGRYLAPEPRRWCAAPGVPTFCRRMFSWKLSTRWAGAARRRTVGRHRPRSRGAAGIPRAHHPSQPSHPAARPAQTKRSVIGPAAHFEEARPLPARTQRSRAQVSTGGCRARESAWMRGSARWGWPRLGGWCVTWPLAGAAWRMPWRVTWRWRRSRSSDRTMTGDLQAWP
mmetsp:Transcript_12697/g.32349  ORF Transcript_12697/g.32349 Transcript_12697/m.32349 type:complete len:239 (+) Transcript_12697:1054-1770(+)